MRRCVMLLASAIVLASCASPDLSTAPQASQLRAGESARFSSTHPYRIAAPYAADSVMNSLSGSPELFGYDPESIGDAEFESHGLALLTTERASLIDADFLQFEEGVLVLGGGGGGGGGENQAMSWGPDCYGIYARAGGRCRRLWSSRGRAVCYGVVMAAYAICLADQ